MNRPLHSHLLRYLLISFATLGIGMLFYGLYNKLIIIQLPTHRKSPALEQRNAQAKPLRLWYWNGEQFAKEDKELIYTGNVQDTLADLVSRWLSLLEEEHTLSKKVTVQSVLLDLHNTTAFISFTRNPLKKELSTHDKIMFFEALLKTLRESDIQLKKVQFLANHKPIQDLHLDFDRAWSITGYVQPS